MMGVPAAAGFNKLDWERKFDKAESLQDQGGEDKLREAVGLLRENLAASTQHLGPRHPTTLSDQDSLSDCLFQLGEHLEAVRLDKETLRIRKDDDEKSEATLATQHSLATNFSQLGKHEDSIKLSKSTSALRKHVLGEDHEDTLETRHLLAYDLHKCKKDKEASDINSQVLRIREGKLVPDDPDLIASRHNLAINLHALKKLDKALDLGNENLRGLAKRPETDRQLGEVKDLQKLIKDDIRELATREKRDSAKKEADQEAEKEKRKGPSQTQAETPKPVTGTQETTSQEENQVPGVRHVESLWVKEQQAKERKLDSPDNLASPLSLPPNGAAPRSNRPTSSHERRNKGNGLAQASNENQKRLEKPSATDELPSITIPQTSPTKTSSPRTPRHNSNSGKVKQNGETKPPSPSPSSKPQPRAKSNERQPHNELNASTLQVSLNRGRRSRSVGAELNEQSKTSPKQEEVYTYSNLCDSHNGRLSDTTHVQASSGWFGQMKKTQSLISAGRKPLGKSVRIAILDTGIDLAHPHFSKSDETNPDYGRPKDRVKGFKSFVDGKDADQDTVGHGTHAAALLLALAPKASIYVAGVVEKNGNLSSATVAKAIRHATDEWKVKIISMSFGWPHHHFDIEKAIDHAAAKNVFMCAAASNDGALGGVQFPANFPPVICVHATNQNGRRSEFTPLARPKIQNFAVLGESVEATWPGKEQKQARSGTSIATPILAAVIALVLEFIYQKPKSKVPVRQDERLETPRGMTHLLGVMGQSVDGYHLVQPWKILNPGKGRKAVEDNITRIMDEEFPEA